MRGYPRTVIVHGCEDRGMVISSLFNIEICIEIKCVEGTGDAVVENRDNSCLCFNMVPWEKQT